MLGATNAMDAIAPGWNHIELAMMDLESAPNDRSRDVLWSMAVFEMMRF